MLTEGEGAVVEDGVVLEQSLGAKDLQPGSSQSGRQAGSQIFRQLIGLQVGNSATKKDKKVGSHTGRQE